MKCIKQSIFVVLSAMMIISCKQKVEVVEQPQTVFAVDTVKVLKGDINDYLKLSGDIKSKREIKVFPDQQGKIAVINVKLGEYVPKGKVLMEIDPSKPGNIYSNSPVRAPVEGSITSLPFKVGETINYQTPIASIGNLEEIEVNASVSEKYLSKIKMGLAVLITVDAYPDEVFQGKISEISPVIDQASRMLDVTISVDRKSTTLLKPGMYANLKIITEKKTNTVKIPSDCITSRYGDTFVFVIKEIPTEIDNVSLNNKILKETSKEDAEFVNKYFPKRLPDELKVDFFEYKLLKILKDKDQIDSLKSLYVLNKDKEIYELNDKVNFTPAHEAVWLVLVDNNYKYMVSISDEKIRQPEIDKIRNILVEKKFVSADTHFVEKRNIKSGIEIDNKTEINKGLFVSEEIVFYGQSLLENNSMVKIMQQLNILTKEDIIK